MLKLILIPRPNSELWTPYEILRHHNSRLVQCTSWSQHPNTSKLHMSGSVPWHHPLTGDPLPIEPIQVRAAIFSSWLVDGGSQVKSPWRVKAGIWNCDTLSQLRHNALACPVCSCSPCPDPSTMWFRDCFTTRRAVDPSFHLFCFFARSALLGHAPVSSQRPQRERQPNYFTLWPKGIKSS